MTEENLNSEERLMRLKEREANYKSVQDRTRIHHEELEARTKLWRQLSELVDLFQPLVKEAVAQAKKNQASKG